MHNPFQATAFLKSAPASAHFPPDGGREVAFAGRSNSGKSSAINLITGRKGLARTSKTPGRTQMINFFDVAEGARLVDLPGYGYAKVPPAMQEKWRELMDAYFRNREALAGVVLIMDIRHPMRDFDRMMLEYAAATELPVHVLLTKSDKLKRGRAAATFQSVRRDLAGEATVQLFSALKGDGRDEAREVLREWLGLPDVP